MARGGKAKTRGRKPSRTRAPRPQVATARAILNPGQLFRKLLADLPGDDEPALAAELWASETLGLVYALRFEGEGPEQWLSTGVIDAAERAGNRRGLGALRALEALAPAPMAAAAGVAAGRLAGRGAREPGWASRLGPARALHAWVGADLYGDQEGVYIAFERPSDEPHLLIVLIDHNLGGLAKDAVCLPIQAEPAAREAFEADPGTSVTPIEPPVAAQRVLAAAMIRDMTLDGDWDDDFAPMRALVLRRMRDLAPGFTPSFEGPEIDEDAVAGLIDAFAAGSGKLDEADRSVLEHVIVHRQGLLDGDALRWSPIVIELFLCDWLPRKAVLDDEAVERVPDLLKRWVVFAGRRCGLPGDLIDETVTAVAELEDDFTAGMRDETAFGPAKRTVLAMQADGVDLGDETAVQAWIDRFNAQLRT